MVAAVLFDIDGTLVDSNEAHVEVWGRVFRDAGHPVERDAIRGQIGKGGDLLVPALLPDLPEDEQKALADRHGEVFKAEFLDGVAPFPQARALIEAVHRDGAKVVLASSASKAELDHYCTLLDIAGLVHATTTIDDVGTSKPAPDIFATALKKLPGVAPGEAIAVGDTPYDVESAGRVGIRTIALRSGGFAEAALHEAGAITLYDDAADLLARYRESPLAG